MVALTVWYMKRKHMTYDRDDDGGAKDASGLHPEVVLRGIPRAGRSTRNLEAQLVQDMVPRATKEPPKRPAPTDAVRESPPRPRRGESWDGSTMGAAGGGRYGRVGRSEAYGIN